MLHDAVDVAKELEIPDFEHRQPFEARPTRRTRLTVGSWAMRNWGRWARPVACAGLLAACADEDAIWTAEAWDLRATVEPEFVHIEATIADVHGDFIHMSIRKDGYDNGYTIERSPSGGQPDRDWSRVHRWFGDFYPDTYLEGRIDDGSGDGPTEFETYAFRLDRTETTRTNWPDEGGSDYEYITSVYPYADGQPLHPGFEPGGYEIEVYAWYTGFAEARHPSTGGENGVQYIHYERRIVTTRFEIE